MIVTPPNSLGGYQGEVQRVIGSFGEVWDRLTADHLLAGSFGLAAIGGNPDVGDPAYGTLSQVNPTQNTCYTVLNITGAGFLTRIRGTKVDSGIILGRNQWFEITIDDGTLVEVDDEPGNGDMLPPLSQGISVNHHTVNDYITYARFNTSLLIRSKSTVAGDSNLYVRVDYILEP